MSEAIITYQGTAYPADCDHMGHMNVAAYTKKFDEATWVLWATVGMTRAVMDQEDCGLAAIKSETTYVREILPGEAIRVRSRILAKTNRSARFKHEMAVLETDGAEVKAATIEYTVACLDRTARAARPFPDVAVARIEAAIAQAAADVDGEAAA